jgi:myo-inositol 2-dehydrogenase / D-chiro-inositol 1-dehydrogenase
MPAHKLKIGLISAGKIGSMHAEHLTTRIPSAEVVMVADDTGQRLPRTSAQ